MDFAIKAFGAALKAYFKLEYAIDKGDAQKDFQKMSEDFGVIALVNYEFYVCLVASFVFGLIVGALIGCCMKCCDCCCRCCKPTVVTNQTSIEMVSSRSEMDL